MSSGFRPNPQPEPYFLYPEDLERKYGEGFNARVQEAIDKVLSDEPPTSPGFLMGEQIRQAYQRAKTAAVIPFHEFDYPTRQPLSIVRFRHEFDGIVCTPTGIYEETFYPGPTYYLTLEECEESKGFYNIWLSSLKVIYRAPESLFYNRR